MKIRNHLVVAALACIVTTGCSNTDLRVVRQVTAPPKTVALTINDGGSMIPQEHAVDFRAALRSRLEDEGIQVVQDRKDVASLVGNINSYTPGNRALRWLVGFGAGKSSINSTWKLLNPAGEEQGVGNVDGWVAMGFFGGSVSKMHEGAAEKVADFVKGDR